MEEKHEELGGLLLREKTCRDNNGTFKDRTEDLQNNTVGEDTINSQDGQDTSGTTTDMP